MQPFEHEGQRVEFDRIYGEVAGTNKHAETRVFGGGGGGTNGNTAPVSIRSTTITKQEFFLRRDDGPEVAVQLSGVDVPVRDGQSVTMLKARVARDGLEYWYWVRLVNHDMARYWPTEGALQTLSGLKIVSDVRAMMTVFAVLIGTPVLLSMVDRGGVGFLLGVAGAIVYFIRWNMAKKGIAARFDEHCNTIANSLFASRVN